MPMTLTPCVQKAGSKLPELDLAERQALEELRAALRRVRACERLDPAGRSPAQQELDRRAMKRARNDVAAAHKLLDELLAEDA